MANTHMYRAKMQAVQGFAKVLKSGTALNHLSQAARAVVDDQSQVSAMLADWDMLDLKSIHEQIQSFSNTDVQILIRCKFLFFSFFFLFFFFFFFFFFVFSFVFFFVFFCIPLKEPQKVFLCKQSQKCPHSVFDTHSPLSSVLGVHEKVGN